MSANLEHPSPRPEAKALRFAVVSTSLNPASRSRILARLAGEALASRGHGVDWIDLRGLDLPLGGTPGVYDHPGVADLARRLGAADGILLGSAVYNYDVNAAAKNLVELTGQAWKDKVVGFLLSAGGQASYMAVMGLANSLMLDFRCLVLPRFVYALGKQHFSADQVSDDGIRDRVLELAGQMERVAGALKPAD